MRTIKEIVGEDYEGVYDVLEAWGKSGLGWGDYAKAARLSPSWRRRLSQVMRDLRDEGYYGPEAIDGEIVCYRHKGA